MKKALHKILFLSATLLLTLTLAKYSEAQSLGGLGRMAKEKAKKAAERKAKEKLDEAINSKGAGNSTPSESNSGSSSSRRNADRRSRSAQQGAGNVADNPTLQAKVETLEKIKDFNTSTEENFMDLINELDIKNTRSLMEANSGSQSAQQLNNSLRFYEKKFTDIGNGVGLMRYLITDIDNDMNPNQKRTDRKKNLNMLLDYTKGNLEIFPENKNLKEFRAKALKLEQEFDGKFAARKEAVREVLEKQNIKPKGSLYIAGADQMLRKRVASRGKYLKGHVVSNDWYYSKNELGIILYKQAEAQMIIKKSNGDCELVIYTIRADKAGSNSYGKPYVHQGVGAYDILCEKATN